MNEFWDEALRLLREHWAEIVFSALSLMIGLWWGRRRAAKEWKRKEFFNRLIVSLNLIEGDKLLIRTIFETNSHDILNKVAADKLRDASQKTTVENPMIPVDDEDRWFYLNAILNEIAERFALGDIVRDVSTVDPRVPTPVTMQYVLGLTCEAHGSIRQRKVRVMMIRHDLLTNLPEKAPEFEDPRHHVRWETLNILAKQYADHPDHFLRVQLSVPVGK